MGFEGIFLYVISFIITTAAVAVIFLVTYFLISIKAIKSTSLFFQLIRLFLLLLTLINGTILFWADETIPMNRFRIVVYALFALSIYSFFQITPIKESIKIFFLMLLGLLLGGVLISIVEYYKPFNSHF